MSFAKLFRPLFSLSVFLTPLAARGGSFSLNEQSVSGLGSAYAGGAAQAEDASTLFFNPAGIALLDQGELQLGAQLVDPSATFNNKGSHYELPGTPFSGLSLGGGNGGDAGGPNVLPNAYLTQPIFRNERYGDLSVGVGLSVPFGLETDYDPGWVGRYSSLRTKLTTFDIQPTVAYRVFDCISLGASLDVQRASARLTQAIDFGLAAQPLLGLDHTLDGSAQFRNVPTISSSDNSLQSDLPGKTNRRFLSDIRAGRRARRCSFRFRARFRVCSLIKARAHSSICRTFFTSAFISVSPANARSWATSR